MFTKSTLWEARFPGEDERQQLAPPQPGCWWRRPARWQCPFCLCVYIREGIQKNNRFLGYFSQMWVGGMADSQTRSKPLKKTPQKLPFLTRIWESFPPKKLFVLGKTWHKKIDFFRALPEKVVHCCTIFHLRSGLWNIVQGGEAMYVVVDCKWGRRGKILPNWVPYT